MRKGEDVKMREERRSREYGVRSSRQNLHNTD
jgi:hypothetical protein